MSRVVEYENVLVGVAWCYYLLISRAVRWFLVFLVRSYCRFFVWEVLVFLESFAAGVV